MSNIFAMVDTWNNGATVFTAILMNVTDTSSDAASLLMDLQVGGVSKFKVSKAGDVVARFVTLSGDLTVNANTNLGNWYSNFGTGGLMAASNAFYGFSSTSNPAAIPDISWSRMAAGVVGFGTGASGSVAGTIQALLFSSGSAVLVTSRVALTDGAAAALGTLSNAPAAGNPTKWAPVNDNGTTRYVPMW